MRKLDGLKEGIEIAKNRNGLCLSEKYVNTRTPMLWKCNICNEKWWARLNDIKQDKWCPSCAGTLKLTIEEANNFAKEKGGKCLSGQIKNGLEKIKWECENKHRWSAGFIHIRYGAWCPYCGGTYLIDGLKEANTIAENRKGKCLSKKYINSQTKLKWKCQHNHSWMATFANVKRGTWCPNCAHIKRALSSTNSYILYHWKTKEELICQGGWEKAVVDYLNKNKINFKWQNKIFNMPNGKTYRPDFYLFGQKKWIEIKGYFRKDAKEKWDWFQTEHSNSELWDFKKLKEMKIIKR